LSRFRPEIAPKASGLRPDLLRELSAYSALSDILAGFNACGQGQGKGKRKKTGGDWIATADGGEQRKEGRDWRGEKTEKMGRRGRGGEKSRPPPRSF